MSDNYEAFAPVSRRRFFATGLGLGAAGLFGTLAQPSAAFAAELPFSHNEELVHRFRERRGGSIGTGGKVAVAFRCDHHLNQFQSKIFPLHQKYSIPVTIAGLSQMFTYPKAGNGNSDMSFASLQTMALRNGFEVANHGATHLDAATSQALRNEIVHSRSAIAQAMPKLPIDLFSPPGVGGTRYQGFQGGRSQAAFQTFLAGRVITQSHAVSTGYVPGYWPMTGDPLDSMGNGHIGIENADYALKAPNFVTAARRLGRGACFMYHPNLINDEDLAALESFFAWCANERDAGRMEILTVSGLMMSDFKSTGRHDLLGAGSTFRRGWGTWNGAASKWAIRSEDGTFFARRGAASGPLECDFLVGVHAGSSRQLRLKIRSTGGARVRVEIFDPAAPAAFTSTTDVVLASSGVFGTVHKYLTLPLTGSRVLRVRITPLSGGEIHVQHPELLAA